MGKNLHTRNRLAVIAGCAVLGVIGVTLLWRSLSSSSTPPLAIDAGANRLVPSNDTNAKVPPLLSVELVQAELERNGFSGNEAMVVARSISGYVTGIAHGDIESLADLAKANGAEPDPFLLEVARKHLSVIPPNAGPSGWQEWSPKQLVSFIFNMSPDRWQSIDSAQITIDRFHGADALTRDLEFYRGSRQHRDATNSVYASPFTIPDLERRLQEGDAAGAVVTFPVTNQDGEKQLVTILLGEYSPGRWFPVRHRTLSFAQAGAR